MQKAKTWTSIPLSLAIDTPNQTSKPTQKTSPPNTPPSRAALPIQLDRTGYSTLTDSSYVGEDDEPLVAVIGCGYVGAHLIQRFSSQYDVLGFDATFTLDPRELARVIHFLISVPILLNADKTIDTSYIQSALIHIKKYARAGSTVVIESSVAIGMTRQLLGPLARERGFFAGMSPERILSGLDGVIPGSLDAIAKLYSRVFDTIVPVSTPETAKMTKLYENCQRMIYIAYANEMADAYVGHGIDPYEVYEAASTKPFGYTPYTPSLGVGGYCIPVNPYYLMTNSSFPLLKHAAGAVRQGPERIGHRIIDTIFQKTSEAANGQDQPALSPLGGELLHINRPIADHVESVQEPGLTSLPDIALPGHDSGPDSSERPWVLVVGVGFKAGQSCVSNSPGLMLIQTLADSGRVDAMFADPLVEQSAIPHIHRLGDNDWNKEVLEGFDKIIVVFRQTGLDFEVLKQIDSAKVDMWCPWAL
ncbi:hypothetical protein GGS23DRAFT_606829 [Durotheca rogersii]|uniref:uncharacterized protein n=1 Tax=Durotheca rogersii TaxID=419775 RepID=UPI0022210FA6|nr:uncharacterized protein GGS23DRAFT_606829 [Durotheca rogersii]KAI5860561.1 hypothetical protein GGS23DRAFT_606829 [Durotheca rogersii]